MSRKQGDAGPRYEVTEAELYTSFVGARRINVELRKRLDAAGVTDHTPIDEVEPIFDRFRSDPPSWCEPAAWDTRINGMLAWGRSFGTLEVVNALDKAGGSQAEAIKLHQRTLPELRERWMPRFGKTPPPRKRANQKELLPELESAPTEQGVL